MVKAGILFVPLLAAFLPISNLSAKDLADYQLGDKAEGDIIATLRMTIPDPEGTEALKQKTADRVPVVIRFYTNALAEVDARFQQSFSKAQRNFLTVVNSNFHHRVLTAEELGSPEFSALVASFQAQNKAFPLNANRAALWASGDSDNAYRSSLSATLRKVMSQPMQPDTTSGAFQLDGSVTLISTANSNATFTAQDAEHGTKVSHNSLAKLANVKKDFQAAFPNEERDVAKSLASFLKMNCVIDGDATQQLRAKRTENLLATVNYEVGDVVAHRGETIDKKTMAALAQLKEKAVTEQLQELKVKQQVAVGQIQTLMASDQAKTAQSQERVHWLAAALGAAALLLVVTTWQLVRRRRSVSLLPVPFTGGAEQWQQRALAAEQRTEKLQIAARVGLIAHLSRWLSHTLTQRLISQRRLLLDAQDNAASEMTELQARLEKIHAPLQDRLMAYERRIAELEKELTARGEENRALLKAKIEMMRKQLEAERVKNRVEFN